jgi:hypothetical protein
VLHRGADRGRWTATTSIQHDWHDLGHPRERTVRATGSLSGGPVGTDGASHAEQTRPDEHEHTGGNLRSGQERGTANKRLELSREPKWQRLPRRSSRDTLLSAAAQLNRGVGQPSGSRCFWRIPVLVTRPVGPVSFGIYKERRDGKSSI